MVDISKIAQAAEANALKQTEALKAGSGGGTGNYAEMFVKSAGYGLVEPFGFDAPPEVTRWNVDNPAGATVANLAGGAAPYLAAYKVGKLPKIAQRLEKIGDVAEAPMKAGALRAMALTSPVEAAKVVGNVAQAESGEDIKDAFATAAFNLALEGAGGTLWGAFQSAGKSGKNLKAAYGLESTTDMRQPSQMLYRELSEKVAKGELPEESLSLARNKLANYEKEIRVETPASRTFVGKLKGDGDARQLNRLFNFKVENKPIGRRLIQSNTDGLPNEAAKADVLERAGLSGNLQYVQYPRFYQLNSKNSAKKFEDGLVKAGKLQTLGDDLVYAQEESGMFVVGKKIKGKLGEKTEGDEWVLFKTDKPSKFAGDSAKFNELMVERTAWLDEGRYKPNPEMELDVLDEVYNLNEELPLRAYGQAATKGNFSKGWDYFAKQTGLENAGQSALTTRMRETFRDYLAPAMNQFKGNPRAQRIWSLSKATYDKAAANTRALIYGDELLSQGRNQFKRFLGREAAGGMWKGKASVKTLLDALSPEEIGMLERASLEQLDPQAARGLFEKGEITENALKAIEGLDAFDDYMMQQLNGTMKAVGATEVAPLKAHYMISRTWDGDLRVPIMDEAGRTLYIASGKNAKAAMARADAIVEAAAEEGMVLTRAEEAKIFNTEDDIAQLSMLRTNDPRFKSLSQLDMRARLAEPRPKEFKERTGVGGYKTNYSKDELIERIEAHTARRNQYMANLSVNKILESDLERLRVDDPRLFEAVTRRLNTLAGVQGDLAKKQNAAVDRVMSPILGRNSATKISGAMNEFMHHMQLGMGNLAYAALNATTFLQTTLPRVSFLMSAESPTLTRHFTFLPALGADARPKGSFGSLDMFKLVKNSFSEMRNMGDDLLEAYNRAQLDGVVDPKFVEEYAGQNASRAAGLREVLKGEQGAVSWIKEVSNFMPALSEKFGRAHTFTMGHMVGRDFFKLEGDQLYRFAKEFTEQTMFNYSQADRARIMTAPLGSLFGLFKNWQAHYVAQMMEYTGEGAMRGNWNPLLWMMGGTTAVGGVAATPAYFLADTASKWMSDEPLMNNLYSYFGGTDEDSMGGGVVDAIYMGLPAFLGVSMSGQAAMPLSDPARDAGMLFSIAHWDRARALGTGVGAAFDRYALNGEHPANSEEVRMQMVKALTPKAFSRAMSITQNNAVRSLNTGNQISGELNMAEQLLYQMGFNPRRLALAHEVNEQLFQKQKSYRGKMQQIAKAWTEAQDARDWDSLKELQMIAIRDGIDLSSVLRSVQTRQEKRNESRIENAYKPEDTMFYKRLGLIE